jgi:transcriptional regulator with XRE-family HTH domain
MTKKSASTTAKRKPATARKAQPARSATPIMDGASSLTGSIRSLAGQMMGIAGAAVDASLGVGGLLVRDPKQRKDLARAGSFLRGVRERTGMTLADVGQAVDLKNVELLELAENGKAALPFEVILRLAAVLARNDPVPFVMNLTNTYSPSVGRTLQALGIGRLVEHARREHDFITIYRARDAARRLSDAEFARVLAFVEAAFDLALDFTTGEAKSRKGAKGQAKPGPAPAEPDGT